MTAPRHHASTRSATRRTAGLGRAGLVVLAVLAAFFTPVRSTTASVRIDADHTHRDAGAHAADSSRLEPAARIARVARHRVETHHRTRTPFGTVPPGVVVAAALLVVIAVASRTRPSTRRPHPSFLRRGPPLLPTAG